MTRSPSRGGLSARSLSEADEAINLSLSTLSINAMTPRFQDDYKGDWLNNARHGTGRMSYQNGDVYEGEWQNDMRSGHGQCIYANGDVYDGEWKNDNRNGHGTYTFANGDEYEGDWKDDVRMNGHGVMRYADGSIYEGALRTTQTPSPKRNARSLCNRFFVPML